MRINFVVFGLINILDNLLSKKRTEANCGCKQPIEQWIMQVRSLPPNRWKMSEKNKKTLFTTSLINQEAQNPYIKKSK